MSILRNSDDFKLVANQISIYMEDRQNDLLKFCSELTECDSINPPGCTIKTSRVIQKFFEEREITSQLLGSDAQKPNVIAEVSSDNLGKHLILNGHMDTVSPGNEADWSVPILKSSLQDGKLMGLGVGNMKAGTAAMALAFSWLYTNVGMWSGKVSYTAVADETVFGDFGAAWLLSEHTRFKGDAVICGEGAGEMNIALAEKGLLWIEIKTKAKSGQGMLANTGTSAITKLCQIVSSIDKWNQIFANLPENLAYISGGKNNEGLRLSVNVGEVSGGHFISQIATDASAKIDIRIPPGLTIQEICAWLDEICANATDTSWRMIKGWNPSWTGKETEIATAIKTAAQEVLSENKCPVVRLPASDASRWRALGVPAVCIGPQPNLVSGVDDFAWVKDVTNSAKIYALSSWIYLNT